MQSNRVKHLLVVMIAVLAFGAVASVSASAFNRPTWRKGGAATATNTKLNVNDNSDTSRLWNKELGVVIVCKKDVSKGTIENHENAAKEIEGLDTASVVYEECTPWSTTENAKEQIIQKEVLTLCKVQDSVRKVAEKIEVPETKTFLAYRTGAAEKEVVDVVESKEAEEVFVTLELTGTSCALKGSYKIKGSVIGMVKRAQTAAAPTEEAVMQNVLFETNNEPAAKKVLQRFPTYELNKVVSPEDTLKFGTNQAALESTEQIELAPNAAVPLGPEPFGVHN